MKKYFVLILVLSNICAYAGEFRANLYGGYVLDDKFESYYDYYNYYNGKIKGGFQFGVGAELMLPPFNGAELLYIGQSTTAPTYYYPDDNISSGEKYKDLELNLNYALVGFTRYFLKEGSKVEPFGGLAAGALFASAHDPESNQDRSAVKFSWAIRAGSNFFLSERFAFKLHTMLLSTVQTAGGALYFGTGGYGPGTTTASSMLQWSVSGGIVYRFLNSHASE
jgi:hypothetical protein